MVPVYPFTYKQSYIETQHCHLLNLLNNLKDVQQKSTDTSKGKYSAIFSTKYLESRQSVL